MNDTTLSKYIWEVKDKYKETSFLWDCYQIVYDRKISIRDIISVSQICADLFNPKWAHLEKVCILTFH